MFALLAPPAARQSAALTFSGRADGDGCSPATLILLLICLASSSVHSSFFLLLFFFLSENPIFFYAFNLACIYSEEEVSGRPFVSFLGAMERGSSFRFGGHGNSAFL